MRAIAMSIELHPANEKYLFASIKRFVAEHLDADIGNLKASLFLGFCVRKHLYRAIATVRRSSGGVT
jgi:hypothetical protein